MKVLIVDDEPLALRRLARLLREAGVGEVLVAENAYQAKEILQKEQDIEAVFLDVRMPGKTGIELAKEIIALRDDVFIIFQTAYEEYTLPAFEIGAVGYLTKPFFLEDVVKVLNRIRRYRGEKVRIPFVDNQGKLILKPYSEVYYFEAKLKHSIGYLKEGHFVCQKSLAFLEKILKPYGFLRIHKSYLVNLDKIRSLTSLPDGKMEVCIVELNRVLKTSKLGAKRLREILRLKTKEEGNK